MTIHKVEWWSNQGTGSPVIFAGEVADCGGKWVTGSHDWKQVTCMRCLKHKKRLDRIAKKVKP